ncbi:MAG TPA: PilZ domain-containing protein [Sphingomicrobium sp.]|nr:PilZ domain-containing protein [Sphingomicrobium sp.]
MGAEPNQSAMKLDTKPADRRERRQVSLRALAIRADSSTVEIVLLDLSYEGCGIETPVDLEPGEPIKLSVLHRGVIDAHVRWCEKGRAGLTFEPEKSAQKKHWPRRHERISLAAEVSLKRHGQNSYRVRVNDLSPDGCKVDLVERPRVEEHMLVKFEGLEVLDAEVCWVEGYVAGLRFEKRMHPAVFDLLLQRLG